MSDVAVEYSESADALEAAPQFFPEVRWKGRDAVIGLIPVLSLLLFAEFIAPETFQTIALPANIFLQLWIWFYPVAAAWIRGAQFHQAPVRTWGREAILALPTLFTIWLLLGIVFTILLPVMGRPENPIPDAIALSSSSNPLLWIIVAVATIGAPIGEELFFRALIYRSLKQYVDIRLAIVLQGLIFGFGHTFGNAHAVWASLLGIALALVYEWRQTILAPICVHCLQNSAAMIAAFALSHTIANGPALGVFGTEDPHGCKITHITEEGSAAAAGMKVGDTITEFNGQLIMNMDQLRSAVRLCKVGEKVVVKFYRDDELESVDVELRRRAGLKSTASHEPAPDLTDP